jgi:hypothetical protein
MPNTRKTESVILRERSDRRIFIPKKRFFAGAQNDKGRKEVIGLWSVVFGLWCVFKLCITNHILVAGHVMLGLPSDFGTHSLKRKEKMASVFGRSKTQKRRRGGQRSMA